MPSKRQASFFECINLHQRVNDGADLSIILVFFPSWASFCRISRKGIICEYCRIVGRHGMLVIYATMRKHLLMGAYILIAPLAVFKIGKRTGGYEIPKTLALCVEVRRPDL